MGLFLVLAALIEMSVPDLGGAAARRPFFIGRYFFECLLLALRGYPSRMPNVRFRE
jgi:hypothetical protein